MGNSFTMNSFPHENIPLSIADLWKTKIGEKKC